MTALAIIIITIIIIMLYLNKSACLHYDYHNSQFSYDINGNIIISAYGCTDLRVMLNSAIVSTLTKYV